MKSDLCWTIVADYLKEHWHPDQEALDDGTLHILQFSDGVNSQRNLKNIAAVLPQWVPLTCLVDSGFQETAVRVRSRQRVLIEPFLQGTPYRFHPSLFTVDETVLVNYP